MTSLRLLAVCLLLLTVSVVAGACDSGDPIDEPSPADVAGVYSFTTLTFDPDAAVLPNYNVLDTVNAQATQLNLLDSGTFVLTYGLRGGPTDAATGNFGVTAQEVRIRGSERQREKFAKLLLNNDFNLQRSPNDGRTLTAQIRKTVDLAALSSRYAGVPPVEGTLFVTLRR